MIKKLLLGLVGAAFLIGFVKNALVDPAGAVAGLVVFSAMGYVTWRAWPVVRGDLGRLLPKRGRREVGLF